MSPLRHGAAGRPGWKARGGSRCAGRRPAATQGGTGPSPLSPPPALQRLGLPDRPGHTSILTRPACDTTRAVSHKKDNCVCFFLPRMSCLLQSEKREDLKFERCHLGFRYWSFTQSMMAGSIPAHDLKRLTDTQLHLYIYTTI